MTRIFSFGLIGIGALTLAIGWLQAGYPLLGLAALILLILWLAAVKWNNFFAPSIIFALLVILAVIGVERMLPFHISLAGILCALAAWDLEHFSRRLQAVAEADDRSVLERHHLLRLGLILILGVGIAYLALAIRVTLQFNLAVGMVLVAIGGLGALVSWLRKRED